MSTILIDEILKAKLTCLGNYLGISIQCNALMLPVISEKLLLERIEKQYELLTNIYRLLFYILAHISYVIIASDKNDKYRHCIVH